MSSQRHATCPGVTDYGRQPSVAWVPVGWKKVETFEGIFRHLARPMAPSRVLCGDFNTPQAEWADGTVITFGQVIGDDGQVTVRLRRQGGPGERWDAAERSRLTGLAAHDPAYVFRRLHGYGVAA